MNYTDALHAAINGKKVRCCNWHRDVTMAFETIDEKPTFRLSTCIDYLITCMEDQRDDWEIAPEKLDWEDALDIMEAGGKVKMIECRDSDAMDLNGVYYIDKILGAVIVGDDMNKCTMATAFFHAKYVEVN